MSNNYINLGDAYGFTDVGEHRISDHLPPAVYSLVMRVRDETRVPVLEIDRESFNIPKRFFGAHDFYKSAMLAAFKKHDRGIISALFTGPKGNGKSVLTEDIANQLLKEGYPVVMVRQKIPVEIMRKVFKHIGKCVIIFDEFEKVFTFDDDEDDDDTAAFLGFLTDKIFDKIFALMTVNSEEKLSQYMRNRPQRIKFRIDFPNPNEDQVKEILTTKQMSQQVSDYLLTYFTQYRASYDVVLEVLSFLNETTTVKEVHHQLCILNVARPTIGQWLIPKDERVYGYTLKSGGFTEYTIVQDGDLARYFLGTQSAYMKLAPGLNEYLTGDQHYYNLVPKTSQLIECIVVDNYNTHLLLDKEIRTGIPHPSLNKENKEGDSDGPTNPLAFGSMIHMIPGIGHGGNTTDD